MCKTKKKRPLTEEPTSEEKETRPRKLPMLMGKTEVKVLSVVSVTKLL